LVSLAKKNIFIANFHVLGLYIPKNEFRANFFFRLSRGVAVGFFDEIWCTVSSAVLSARKLKFWSPASFEPTWCTSYSEFEILKFL
jgi:hypothetical protein